MTQCSFVVSCFFSCFFFFVILPLRQTFIQFLFRSARNLTPVRKEKKKMTSSLRGNKNKEPSAPQRLSKGQRHVTVCRIYTYWTIKCQVPSKQSTIRNSDTPQKIIRQLMKEKKSKGENRRCWGKRGHIVESIVALTLVVLEPPAPAPTQPSRSPSPAISRAPINMDLTQSHCVSLCKTNLGFFFFSKSAFLERKQHFKRTFVWFFLERFREQQQN